MLCMIVIREMQLGLIDSTVIIEFLLTIITSSPSLEAMVLMRDRSL